MEKPNYYAIIPATVRYDKELKPMERLMYGEITALCNTSGYCWCTNQYFAELYGVSIRMVREWISHLKDRGYVNLKIIYKEGTKEVLERRIYIVPISAPTMVDPEEENFLTPGNNLPEASGNKFPHPGEENFRENNININNTSMNNNYVPATEKRAKKFVKPTIQEITDYCRERNNRVDAQKFFNYYESNGWKVGKNPMKDWKAAVRTWERNGYSGSTTEKQQRQYGSNNPEGFDFFDF